MRETGSETTAPGRLDIEVVPGGDSVTVVASGEIDLATADDLRLQMDAAAARFDRLVLDLRGVTFIDSTGLRVVVDRVRKAGPGEFAVVPGSASIQRVFELTGLTSVVPFLENGSH